MKKIGVRAHDYGKMEPEKLAQVLSEEGFACAQLALPKVIAGIDSYADITLNHLDRIRESFLKWNLDIPVFSCYQDLGNPDPDIRKYALDTMKKCLAYSKEVGAGVVGTETAYPRLSPEQKKIWHPYMMDSIKAAVEEAARLDVKLAIEPVHSHPLQNLETVLEVFDVINDPKHLRMIFDMSNLLPDPDHTDQKLYWNEWLNETGKYIEALHIKDFILDENGEYQGTLLGEGVLDYGPLSEWISKQSRTVYLLREELDPQNAKQDMAFLKKL